MKGKWLFWCKIVALSLGGIGALLFLGIIGYRELVVRCVLRHDWQLLHAIFLAAEDDYKTNGTAWETVQGLKEFGVDMKTCKEAQYWQPQSNERGEWLYFPSSFRVKEEDRVVLAAPMVFRGRRLVHFRSGTNGWIPEEQWRNVEYPRVHEVEGKRGDSGGIAAGK